MTSPTITWKPYSETQKQAAASYTRKTAPRANLSACAALAAKTAIKTGRTTWVFATAYGYTIADFAPAGQRGLVFEAERYGEF
jgi:hypothetical protein